MVQTQFRKVYMLESSTNFIDFNNAYCFLDQSQILKFTSFEFS